MWFGTFDGLNKYDGRTITVYMAQVGNDTIRSISHGTIKTLTGDKKGHLFIGTYGGGLNVLDLETSRFKYFQEGDPASIMDNYINDLLFIDDSTLWIATNKGVSLFNPLKETFINYPFEPVDGKISELKALSLYVDADRTLWLGTFGDGLFRLDRKTGKFKNYRNHTSDENLTERNYIRKILDFNDNYMLLSTKYGLFLFDPVKEEFKTYLLEGKTLNRVSRDNKGNYWISSFYYGLYMLDKNGNIFEFKNNTLDERSFPDDRLYDIYCDNRGNIWVGSNNSGAIYIDLQRKPFTNVYSVPNRPSIPDNSVFDLLEDEHGNIWVGTERGLSVWDRKNNSFRDVEFKLLGNKKGKRAVWNLFLEDDRYMWIATSFGAVKYDIETQSQVLYNKIPDSNKGIVFDDINYIIKDNDGYIWLATINGVSRFDEKTNTFYDYRADGTPNSLSHSQVWSLYKDSKCRICLTTVNGINLYDPERDNFKVYRFPEGKDGILSNDISSMCEIEDGKFLLATSKGVSVFDSKTEKIIKNIGVRDGLPNSYIYRFLVNSKTIWASSNKGLVVIDRKTFKVIDKYFEQDGLPSNEFNTAALKSSDGYFMFGGVAGITCFNPDSIHKSDFVPPIYFTGISVMGEEVIMEDTLRSEDIKFKKNINSASRITFLPEEKLFTIRFSALDYSNPQRVKYFYRLLPMSKEWIGIGESNFVTFANLRHGKYELQVKSTNGDGILCDNVRSVEIVIQPPFWRRKGVIISEIVLLLLSTFLFYKYRTYKFRKEKEKLERVVKVRTSELEKQKQKIEHFASELEEKVKERTAELEQAKLQAEESDKLKTAFLSNMSHEIRTPMNAIVGFSELLSTPGLTEEERKDFANMVRTNSDSLLTLLNDIIDISMIESGQLKFMYSDVEVGKLINDVYQSFKGSKMLEEKKDLKMILSVDENDRTVINTDYYRVKQVLNNLMGNAIKFTDNGFVEIGFEKSGNEIVFFVKDTGIGISKENTDKIFNRFYKKGGESGKVLYSGSGLGLTITRNLVEALHGRIWVVSEEGEGAEFYFTLPLKS
jgi:signal transduction histidine kinase/ligand-binding sensor domain-containing protein